MNIIYSKKASKVISRVDSVSADRIRAAVENLPDGDVKQLTGGDIVTHRLRVGAWRVLFYFTDDNTITIEKIAPRGDAYKRL